MRLAREVGTAIDAGHAIRLGLPVSDRARAPQSSTPQSSTPRSSTPQDLHRFDGGPAQAGRWVWISGPYDKP